jgi:hypothetical protein
MSDRVRELADRRGTLQLRCAAQRGALGREVSSIETRLRSVDRLVAIARGALLHPAVLAVGAATLFALGRRRAWRALARGLLLAGAARRLFRAVRKT